MAMRQGTAARLASGAAGSSHLYSAASTPQPMSRLGTAAIRDRLSSLARRIWSISSMAASVSSFSRCTWIRSERTSWPMTRFLTGALISFSYAAITSFMPTDSASCCSALMLVVTGCTAAVPPSPASPDRPRLGRLKVEELELVSWPLSALKSSSMRSSDALSASNSAGDTMEGRLLKVCVSSSRTASSGANTCTCALSATTCTASRVQRARSSLPDRLEWRYSQRPTHTANSAAAVKRSQCRCSRLGRRTQCGRCTRGPATAALTLAWSRADLTVGR
mmetsp:Transcript_22666/g.57735  ORF Transcript_22666/g.57735 Transcript_22666/m.57735 type:complete len:278 (-) Transcript_22666:1984-2817(-)